MKIKNNGMEEFLYILACIGSFGFVCILRIIITVAIRKALESKEEK